MFARTFKRSRDLVEPGGGRRDAKGRATCPRSRVLDSARAEPAAGRPARPRVRRKAVRRTRPGGRPQCALGHEQGRPADRTRVEKGKSVGVGVDVGGRSMIKKKTEVVQGKNQIIPTA